MVQNEIHACTQVPVAEQSDIPKTRRWNPETAREILSQWRISGLSLAAFCRERGLGYQRLLGWRKKLSGDGNGGFIRIHVPTSFPTGIEIELACGRTIRFPPDIDPRYIRSLVDQMER